MKAYQCDICGELKKGESKKLFLAGSVGWYDEIRGRHISIEDFCPLCCAFINKVVRGIKERYERNTLVDETDIDELIELGGGDPKKEYSREEIMRYKAIAESITEKKDEEKESG